MIDIHSHILPNVDDGSKTIEDSILMIKKEISDGVTDLILTPHVQSRVTKASKERHIEIFNELVDLVKLNELNINIYLGAEIFFRSHIDTDYDKYSLANTKYILVEFAFDLDTPIDEIVYDLSRSGYIPIVAHVERYSYLNLERIKQIKQSGALLQVNTTSVLGYDDKVKKSYVYKLLKEKLIDFVATDTHNLEKREPNMLKCYQVLAKTFDTTYLDLIFRKNQELILNK
jgi:protein-tyrosine phosphatase